MNIKKIIIMVGVMSIIKKFELSIRAGSNLSKLLTGKVLPNNNLENFILRTLQESKAAHYLWAAFEYLTIPVDEATSDKERQEILDVNQENLERFVCASAFLEKPQGIGSDTLTESLQALALDLLSSKESIISELDQLIMSEGSKPLIITTEVLASYILAAINSCDDKVWYNLYHLLLDVLIDSEMSDQVKETVRNSNSLIQEIY